MPENFSEPATRAAYRASIASVAFSLVASSLAIAIGLGESVVLVAFGGIGLVDMIGSIVLTYHFRRALHHEAASPTLERAAHRVVRIGLFAVGVAAIVVSVMRLVTGDAGSAPAGGGVLAAISLVALAALSSRKRALGREVGSRALLADGRVSGIGAAQAAVTLIGLVVTLVFDLGWADAVAAIVVGLGAVVLAVADPD